LLSASPNIALVEPYAKRWRREDYYRLYEAGCFQEERTELIDGEILVMSPQSYAHANAIHLVFNSLATFFMTNIRCECKFR